MGGDDDGDHVSNDTPRCSFSSTSTNWSVAAGTLDAAVAFESSASPIVAAAAAAANSISPLFLRRPSSDPPPCEIKISFTQKHQVRQVYVRSSARLYEIYYAPDPQSCSDYLCTVRCGIVTENRRMVRSNDIDEETSCHLKGLNKQLKDNKPRNFSSSSSNEDDWVDVNVPGLPPFDNGNSSLQTKVDNNRATGARILFEATAEISDANPCISLTVRLLSLQDKESVCVDEIYVFADLIDSTTSESHGSPMESPARSSLMTMLVPTLLQLSKPTVSRQADKSLYTSEKQNFQEFGPKANNSNIVADNIQHEVQLQKVDAVTAEPAHEVQLQKVDAVTAEPAKCQSLPQVLNTEKKPSFIGKESHLPSGHLESAMEQVISRVARIEDLCLRFEESMLRPICSIEARLQHVEQQLEVLNKKSGDSEALTCLRFSAPEFTGTSESNSFYNDGGELPTCPVVDEMEFPSDKSSTPPEDDMSILNKSKTIDLSTSPKSMPELAVATYSLPSLVITAPELPDDDNDDDNDNNNEDEEKNDSLEPVKDFPIAVPKQSRSIDDALTSALAGFLASVSTQASKSKPTDAPELSGDDDGHNLTALPAVQSDVPTESAKPFSKSEAAECQKKSTSWSIFLEREELFLGVLKETESKEELGKEVDKQVYLCKKVDEQDTGAENYLLEAEDDVASSDKNQINEDTSAEEASNGRTEKILDPDRTYIPPLHFLGDETDDNSHNAEEGSDGTTGLVSDSNLTKDGLDEDILHGVVNISDSSVVEFEMPSETLSSDCGLHTQKSSLEALMTDMQEPPAAPDVLERDEDSSPLMLMQVNLVEQLMHNATADHHFVHVDRDGGGDIPAAVEACNLQDNDLGSSNL